MMVPACDQRPSVIPPCLRNIRLLLTGLMTERQLLSSKNPPLLLFYGCFNGTELCWLSRQNTFEEKTQGNGGEHLNSPSTSLWPGTKPGVKVVKTRRELILPRAMVTLMISGVYSLVRLIPTRSDQALRKLRITSALFVLVAGGEKAKHRDLVLGERKTRAVQEQNRPPVWNVDSSPHVLFCCSIILKKWTGG